MLAKFKISIIGRVAAATPSFLLLIGACFQATGCPADDDTNLAADSATTDTTSDATTPDGGGDQGGSDEGCESIAAKFQTLGSANDNLVDPMVTAVCVDGNLVITANAIPDFPYIETSPGQPREQDVEYTIPATPTVADTTTAIPELGPLGVAVNGIPIFGPTEGGGGDVMALGDGFSECGGHNGPSGYHYHTFDVTGSDACRWSVAQASAGHILFGYAFDGYPIYSGNFQFQSSYELTDASLFDTDTWGAHTYVEGAGDLDECNGRTDADGNYGYYTTDAFPYVMGCYRGVVADIEIGGGGPPGGGPPGQ